MTELFESIKNGDEARVAELIEGEAALANSTNEQGVSAHTFAIYNRKADIAKLLEERGARIDIFAAAMSGRTNLIDEMLAGNRSLAKLMSHDGWTPLHLAAFFGHKDAAEALLGADASVTERSTNAMANMPLHAGVAGRNFDLVKLLVERGAPVNARQHGGWTPLHAAAQNGDAAMVALFLEHGADVNARADNSQLPMDLALTKGHQEIVTLLEQHGAKF
jgi:ankyrin repeat protein